MKAQWRVFLLSLLACSVARTAVAATAAPTDVSGLNTRCKSLAARGGSGCDNLLSTGAGQDAAGRHLLQQKGLSQAAAAARAHRGYMHWVHGQMMIVAFVGLVPLGVWMAYARRTLPSATWFQAHRAIQVAAWLLNLASVGVICAGLSMSGVKSERVVFVHVCVGIALQIIIGVQALVALLLRPTHDSRLRQSWNVIHRWLGWLVALVALAQLAGGMLLGHRPVRDFWAVFGVLVAWYVAFVALDMFRYAMAPPPGHLHSSVKGAGRGNGDSELLERRQELPQHAIGDVPGNGGYHDGPAGGGLISAAAGQGRRGPPARPNATWQPGSAEV